MSDIKGKYMKILDELEANIKNLKDTKTDYSKLGKEIILKQINLMI